MIAHLKKGSLLFVFCMMVYDLAYTQTAYKLKGPNTMKLFGTSSLHKWSMTSTSCAGDAQFNFTAGATNVLTSIGALSFMLPVLSLKSGKSGLDNNAYKALKTDRYKNIIYTLTSAKVASVVANRYLLKTKGDLNIAGVTKDMAMDVYCTVNKDKTITCTGASNIRMTDHNVQPPTFMSGAMKTGDAIKLEFNMVFAN